MRKQKGSKHQLKEKRSDGLRTGSSNGEHMKHITTKQFQTTKLLQSGLEFFWQLES